jgi:hypothetical protein
VCVGVREGECRCGSGSVRWSGCGNVGVAKEVTVDAQQQELQQKKL